MDAPGATEASEPPRQTKPEQEVPNISQSTDETSDGQQDDRPIPTDERDSQDDEDEAEDDEENESEEDEDEEPRLKYAYLTKHLGSVYRNGDATSSFLTAGDKMVIGTHNGNIHVLSLPLFQSIRVYHAHSASVTSISISPFPSPLPTSKPDPLVRTATEDQSKPPSSSASIRTQSRPSQAPRPSVSSNSIYIATSSMDGNVCVAALADPRDVILRNFGRPVQAVALSPDYKNDRTFLSGGRAGDLILTTGGRVGASSNSTTMGGAAATASSWFGTMGLGTNNGKDTVLHSGEGAINVIRWSLSGKYATWVNEEGIKIMRTNLHLNSADSELAWKRVGHIDRPNQPGWEEMASVWKARAEWVDESSLDTLDDLVSKDSASHASDSESPSLSATGEKKERLVVGWGGTVWIIDVYPDRPNKNIRDQKLGSVEVSTILRTDCIISGISLFTPRLVVVLAYIEAEEDGSAERTKHGVVRPGTRRRQRGLEPELRIIDIESKEELSADTLSISRYESLISSDYHMSVLPPWKAPVSISRRGALGALGDGLWDATLYPARLFSSAGSIRSGTSGNERQSSRATENPPSRRIFNEEALPKEIQDVAGSTGFRIFIHSPFDCVASVKRDLADRLAWLDAHKEYEEAWNLVDEHPEVAGTTNNLSDNVSDVPSRPQSSLNEFFADDQSLDTTTGRAVVSAAQQEKCRIGELWLGQLVRDDKWNEAAGICAKVVNTTPRWEHWAWRFIDNKKLDEISPYIPTTLHPPLSSSVYEVILKHYASENRHKLEELIDSWPLDLFNATNVTGVIEKQLDSDTMIPETEDWCILTKCLAKLYLAGGRYREALRCYVRLQDADTVMSLIKEHRLLDAVFDDIPAFILIRVTKEQLKSAPISELEEATAEPIKVLVSEAYTGIVPLETVVTQLQAKNRLLYLYFYLRALWRGESLPHEATKPRRGRGSYIRDAANKLAADEGKALLDRYADTAVELFANYDRPLLMEFLQTSTSYTFEAAISICETRRYTPELVYLLSKLGQTKRALNLILSDLKDVSQAIAFAKSQDDPDLWEDLLDYSMDKPRFIHGLLVEAGTSVDPIKLVKRIPSGLEIEGLREGLTRLIREHDLQASISQGAAKVLQSEVAVGMDMLRKGQRRGIKFNIVDEHENLSESTRGVDAQDDSKSDTETVKSGKPFKSSAPQPGRCAGCHSPFHPNEKEILIGFACGHIFHLSHVHPEPVSTDDSSSAEQTPKPFPSSSTPTVDEPSLSTPWTVGPKVTTARLLRDRIGDRCRICALAKEIETIGDSEETQVAE